MTAYRFITADVFTDVPFGGNQLAVLPDARGIGDELMLKITREFNYSETVFVLPPVNPKHTRRVRIFTPGGELPFAGHPTVGTAVILAAIGEVQLHGDSAQIVLEEGVGPIPVLVKEIRSRSGFAQFTAAKNPERLDCGPSREGLTAMLSLDDDELLDGHWSPEVYSCGVPYTFVPLRSIGAVRRAVLNKEQWRTHVAKSPASKVYLFAMQGERVGSDIHARMFAPGAGVDEDAATGSAAAALAGYLAVRDKRRDECLRWRIEQGIEMGRPSFLNVEADIRDGKVVAARVGGQAVLISEGTIEV
jgi:trans-2,3-dihydro-3-hydroxyanthranilate isomerase